MTQLKFSKYQATGNDFLLADNRTGQYSTLSSIAIQWLCDRHFGVGADGLILLEATDQGNFAMNYFNANGKAGSFCGNGARCITRFAHTLGITKDSYAFIAFDGPHRSILHKNGEVSLLMQDVASIEERAEYSLLNTGSPHLIVWVDEVAQVDVKTEGRKIRYSGPFRKEGINVNFVQRTNDPERIIMRTYERGVEDETFSCGTGAVAAAICCSTNENGNWLTKVTTRGGELSVSYQKEQDQFHSIWLRGAAEPVFETYIDSKRILL